MQIRYLENIIKEVCFSSHKMAFISGSRQGGKTTMAKHLLKERGVGHYYNWDELAFRKAWATDPKLILAEPVKSIEETPHKT